MFLTASDTLDTTLASAHHKVQPVKSAMTLASNELVVYFSFSTSLFHVIFYRCGLVIAAHPRFPTPVKSNPGATSAPKAAASNELFCYKSVFARIRTHQLFTAGLMKQNCDAFSGNNWIAVHALGPWKWKAAEELQMTTKRPHRNTVHL